MSVTCTFSDDDAGDLRHLILREWPFANEAMSREKAVALRLYQAVTFPMGGVPVWAPEPVPG